MHSCCAISRRMNNFLVSPGEFAYRDMDSEASTLSTSYKKVSERDKNSTDHSFFLSAQITIQVQKIRREFGAPVKFADRNVSDAKDGYIECTSYEDKMFDVTRIEVEKGIQVSVKSIFHDDEYRIQRSMIEFFKQIFK